MATARFLFHGELSAFLAPVRFLADAHLGGLARTLRMLGFDTLYENRIADREILELAAREQRVVLTRDRELLKCREILRGCFVHALKPEAQLKEVAARYGLERHTRPFTLCLHCNLRLLPVDKAAAQGRVPERIVAHYEIFVRCPGCERRNQERGSLSVAVTRNQVVSNSLNQKAVLWQRGSIADFRKNPRGELGTRTATLHAEGIAKLRKNWIYRA